MNLNPFKKEAKAVPPISAISEVTNESFIYGGLYKKICLKLKKLARSVVISSTPGNLIKDNIAQTNVDTKPMQNTSLENGKDQRLSSVGSVEKSSGFKIIGCKVEGGSFVLKCVREKIGPNNLWERETFNILMEEPRHILRLFISHPNGEVCGKKYMSEITGPVNVVEKMVEGLSHIMSFRGLNVRTPLKYQTSQHSVIDVMQDYMQNQVRRAYGII